MNLVRNPILPTVPDVNDKGSMEDWCIAVSEALQDLHENVYDDLITVSQENSKENIKVISSSNYTILDDDGYTEVQVTTGASDRTINLPTLADNQSRKVIIRKIDSGAGKVIVTPEGTELINEWNATVGITEQYGWWEFTAISGKWITKTDGESSILEVSSESSDDLTVDLTWDDVAGMALTLTPGKWLLSAYGSQYCFFNNASCQYIEGLFGLGTASGNNAPNIPKCYDLSTWIQVISGLYAHQFPRHIINRPYSVSSNTVIYMKAKMNAWLLTGTNHKMFGATNAPMYIKAKRIR